MPTLRNHHRRPDPSSRPLPPSLYDTYMDSEDWASCRRWWRAGHPRRRRCEVSGDLRYDLHHRTYARLGCERSGDLVPLSDRHHRRLHALQHRFGWSVETATLVYLSGARMLKVLRFLLSTPRGLTITAVGLLLLVVR